MGRTSKKTKFFRKVLAYQLANENSREDEKRLQYLKDEIAKCRDIIYDPTMEEQIIEKTVVKQNILIEMLYNEFVKEEK